MIIRGKNPAYLHAFTYRHAHIREHKHDAKTKIRHVHLWTNYR